MIFSFISLHHVNETPIILQTFKFIILSMNIVQSLDGFYVFLSDKEVRTMQELSSSSHLQLRTQLTLAPPNQQTELKKELDRSQNLIELFSPDVVLGKNTLEFTGSEIHFIKRLLTQWIRFQQNKIKNTTDKTTLLFQNSSLKIRMVILKKFIESNNATS